jgi:tryptophan synthase beta chain
MERQKLNVDRMRLLGAEVQKVESGTNTLKDATNEAIRDWVTNVDNTYYVIGSVVGPHPYPMMVRNFHRIIGQEARKQINEAEGDNPDYLLACVGGGSNSIGFFHPFIDDKNIRMIGLEAAGCDIDSDDTAATLSRGRPGVLHGSLSFLLQNEEGQVQPVHSIIAGLDYPGVGPEHAHLLNTEHVEYYAVTDQEALEGVKLLSEKEGIIPALETAHAVAWLEKLMSETSSEEIVIVNCSGRGDKDMDTISENI